MKQCEIVAIVKDRKERAKVAMTVAYQTFQKPDLTVGFVKTYRPKIEGDTVFAPERKHIQASVASVLAAVRAPLVTMLDTVRTQDQGNCDAIGNVDAIDGTVSLSLAAVPATHLLFLEKQLVDLLTTAKTIPTLDPSEQWSIDKATGNYRSEGVKSDKQKPVEIPVVVVPPTAEHPAVVHLKKDMVIEGTWEGVKFSGAVPAERKNAIVGRIIALQEAVVKAREQANATEVAQIKEGDEIWQFIFGD